MDQLPFAFAKQHGIFIDTEQASLCVRKGTTVSAIQEVKRTLGHPVGLNVMDEGQFNDVLQKTFANRKGSSLDVMEDIEEVMGLEQVVAQLEDSADLLAGDDDAPIIKLLNSILFEALKEQASDIHVEPYEDHAQVRFRLDGVLRTVLSPSMQIAPLLISRIKVLAKLDIAEKRVPQDGRMSVRLGGRSIDLRVSTLPSSYGERVVLRLLDKNAGQLSLNDLGMNQSYRTAVEELIARPHGIILVTGPTGSGKTTTLYAALQEMDRQVRNIMTVEDPVEYDLPGVSQTQINLRAGMTFAKGLRAILRQDPDVILIGEIRDRETAEIATQASLTGHLVLSTLHTNTAAGAVTRLQDLGVDSFLLSSTVRGVMAQRLVRKLCDECKTPIDVEADAAIAEKVGLLDGETLYTNTGCQACNHTGYTGRLGLFELVLIDKGLQRLVHDKAGEVDIETYIREQVPSITQSGFDMVRQGLTTLDEVLRVTSV